MPTIDKLLIFSSIRPYAASMTRESKRKRYGNGNGSGRKNMFFGACTKSISPVRRLIASTHWNHLRICKSIVNCVYGFLGSVCQPIRLSYAAYFFLLLFNCLFKNNTWFRYANTTSAVQQINPSWINFIFSFLDTWQKKNMSDSFIEYKILIW